MLASDPERPVKHSGCSFSAENRKEKTNSAAGKSSQMLDLRFTDTALRKTF